MTITTTHTNEDIFLDDFKREHLDITDSINRSSPDTNALKTLNLNELPATTRPAKKYNRYVRRQIKAAEKKIKATQKNLYVSSWGHRSTGAGRHLHIEPPTQVSGMTSQLSGLNPFIVPSGAAKIGVPIGRNPENGEWVGYSARHYLEAGITTSPGGFILGQPGIGKSAFVKRQILGLAGMGEVPIILGDVKGEYPAVIKALGGQVVRLGPGLDRINPLDAGAIHEAADRLETHGKHKAAAELYARANTRRFAFLKTVCEIFRKKPLTDKERNVVNACLTEFTNNNVRTPTIEDLYKAIANPSPQVIDAVSHREKINLSDYDELFDPLLDTLRGLASDDSLGGMFNGETTTPLDLDATAINIDISRLGSSTSEEQTMLSIAMLAVWTYSFGVVDGNLKLGEAGLITPDKQRRFVAILDELWLSLRGSPQIVDNIDALLRTNRTHRLSQLLVTHGTQDLESLNDASSIAKAKSMVRNSAVKIIGALSRDELSSDAYSNLTEAEKTMVASWDGSDNRSNTNHPGLGHFLLKSGDGPGITVRMDLLPQEKVLYETTK